MTKEVEVGDEFAGKVVKTTTFGAFVELAKGTDGLLHISNVAPGRGSTTVEEVLNKGDDIAVRVVEVDRERGRIGLRLADDPEVAARPPRSSRASAAATAARRAVAVAATAARDRGGRDAAVAADAIGDRNGGDRGRSATATPSAARLAEHAPTCSRNTG